MEAMSSTRHPGPWYYMKKCNLIHTVAVLTIIHYTATVGIRWLRKFCSINFQQHIKISVKIYTKMKSAKQLSV